MHASTKIEARLFVAALAFLMTCFGLSVYAVYAFGLDVPTCVTSVQPFDKGEVIERAPKHYEIHYVARMWNFDPPEVRVPPGSTLDIYLSSADVTHGFLVMGTNANLMAVPGAVNYTKLKLDREGSYEVVCHEYCGIAHHNMIGVIRVTNEPPSSPPGRVAGVTGERELNPGTTAVTSLLEGKGCLGCHSTNGSQLVGPTFKGLFGKEEHFEDGSEARVDEAYIKESITNPQAKIVKGYQPLMPVVPVTDAEIADIITYLKTLK